ncbi:uncharacterized protein Z518_10795 [Rhinocladiella mackenziei CBS 650.93]|uniref:Metallo-beta-lactamase domain-containing protein n=1 Tax=Rhinocladiella mackenziei CBS 650.93 TaxID=1442369 RepID=A0A0D2GNB1_9EURO|nr:uncharacterized protein Z518_10795 [Rhinocladiella mackenziei CBS 650.93]KIW99867.1 hypothetical protein Z518_10795 [Rhinocladiella mackenziei CBS 650.93]
MTTPKSSASLIPSDPAKVMVIRDVTPTITTLSVPFLRFGRIKIGGRGTLVKLQTGNVAVFSPVALTPDVKAKVQSMGPPKYIIAPDIEHHIFISTWSAEYPEAEIIGMEGLPEKRESDPATKGIKFTHVFSAKNKLDLHVTPEFDEEFSYEYFHSHGNKELVFLHKPTGTMIEADLLFNLPATEQYSKTGINPQSGILTKLFGGIMNTRGDMIWQKRFLWYAAAGKDRAGFAESAKRIKQWDYDRIIPCHGDVIETGGKSIMDKALVWFTEGKH